ncbi:MAG: hypothetical protein A3K67_03095 [Euryarchaeota archaeon RBG_16_62_10]|nr:MAG: hypothetical protein A3K67_03095 [Euryarchaeota archaeon RBG_16_62_10]
MLAITHLLVSLLLIQIFLLDRNDAFVALLFGVFIDADHLIGLQSYAKANGIMAVFDFDSLMHADGQWKSLMHNPVAAGIVAPISIMSRLAVPLLFWAAHIAMDFVEDAYLGIFSTPEAIFALLVGLSLVSIRYGRYIESFSTGTLSHYLRMELDGLRGIFKTEA